MASRTWRRDQPTWSPAQAARWQPRVIPDTDPGLASCDMRAFAKATAKDLQGAFFGVGAAGAAATRLLDHLGTNDDIAE